METCINIIGTMHISLYVLKLEISILYICSLLLSLDILFHGQYAQNQIRCSPSLFRANCGELVDISTNIFFSGEV